MVKRAPGGSDFDLDRLVALCRACHEQTDAPYARGRLVVTPLGLGAFRVDVVYGKGKAARPNPNGFAQVGQPEAAREVEGPHLGMMGAFRVQLEIGHPAGTLDVSVKVWYRVTATPWR